MIVLGLDERITTAIVIGAGVSLFALLLIATAAGELRRRRKAKVPLAMRPAPSDEELERRVLTRYLAWGAAATLLMALWLPLYWFREPVRLDDARQRILAQSVDHGEHIYNEFCLLCHGLGGVGTITTVVRDGVEIPYAEPPVAYMYARYQAIGMSEEAIEQLLRDAIDRGRPGTPMPTWGAAFGGPLNTFEVDTLVDYIVSIQEPFPEPTTTDGAELFAIECAVCHGPDGSGFDPRAGAPSVGPNLQIALERLTLEEVRQVIAEGRININRPSMPTWAALGDEAIDALVRFIQGIQRS